MRRHLLRSSEQAHRCSQAQGDGKHARRVAERPVALQARRAGEACRDVQGRLEKMNRLINSRLNPWYSPWPPLTAPEDRQRVLEQRILFVR